MRMFRLVAVMLVVLGFACAAQAQQMVKPRKPDVSAPATVTPSPEPAPATTTSTANADTTPAPTSNDPASAPTPPTPEVTPAPPSTQLDLNQVIRKTSSGRTITLKDALDAALTAEYEIGILRTDVKSANKKLNWLLGSGAIALFLIFGIVAFRNIRRRRNTAVTVLVCVMGLGLASVASAQTAKIVSITPDAWIRGGDPVNVTITGSGLANTESLEFPTGITVEEVKAVGNKVTAKLTIADVSEPGPVSFNAVLKGGTRVESGDAVTFTIFTSESAIVVDYLTRKMANQTGAVAALRTEVAGIKTAQATLATKADVEARTARIEAALSGLATKASVNEVVNAGAALEKKVTSFEALINQANVNTVNLSGNVAALAGDVATIGNTEVKRGMFGGKKPLDSDAAARAARIKAALDAANALAERR